MKSGKSASSKPTVILMHGAFSDASVWNGVTRRLQRRGYRVMAPAVPQRGIRADVDYLDTVIKSVEGPVILAGHSYGGVLITELAARNSQVRALVYVAGFIPDEGETIEGVLSNFPGSLVGPETTYTLPYPGGTDMYVRPEDYRRVMAGRHCARDVAVRAASQRPADVGIMTEPTTAAGPRDVPKFAIIATEDRAIPTAAQERQARRAGARVYRVRSAHDVPVSRPRTVTRVIERAASAVPHCLGDAFGLVNE